MLALRVAIRSRPLHCVAGATLGPPFSLFLSLSFFLYLSSLFLHPSSSLLGTVLLLVYLLSAPLHKPTSLRFALPLSKHVLALITMAILHCLTKSTYNAFSPIITYHHSHGGDDRWCGELLRGEGRHHHCR
jgi:hypothetical protein